MIDDGLLWLVNRCVFHPRGYALAFFPESGTWMLLGDGSEPWSYLGTEIAQYATPHEGVALVNEHELFAKIKAVMP